MTEEKKIAEEMLNNEELDSVAGGTVSETADDSRFLNTLNGSTDRHSATRLFCDDGTRRNKIIQGWATVGIKSSCESIWKNEYRLDGKEITQEEARRHAMNVTGRHLTESEWKW